MNCYYQPVLYSHKLTIISQCCQGLVNSSSNLRADQLGFPDGAVPPAAAHPCTVGQDDMPFQNEISEDPEFFSQVQEHHLAGDNCPPLRLVSHLRYVVPRIPTWIILWISWDVVFLQSSSSRMIILTTLFEAMSTREKRDLFSAMTMRHCHWVSTVASTTSLVMITVCDLGPMNTYAYEPWFS